MSLVVPRRPMYAGRSINPNTLPGKERVEYWINPRRGLSLGTQLLGLGAAAPGTCTLSADTGGTLTVTLGLFFRIDVSGSVGTMRFSVSIDGGSSFLASLTNVLSSADVALTGLGLRVQWAAGTYTAGTHTYRAVLSQIQEVSLHGRVLVAPATLTSRCWVNWNAINGRPTIFSDGSAKILKDITSGGAAALGTGTAKSRSFYLLFKAGTTTPTGALAMLSLSNTGDADSRWTFSLKNGTNDLWSAAVADAGGAASIVNGGSLDSSYHIAAVVLSGTTLTVYNKTNTPIFSGTQSVGAQTFDSFSICAENLGGSLGNSAPCELGDIVARSGADDAATRLATIGWLKSRFPAAA